MARPQVSILMGSGSDLEVMSEAARVLERFGVRYELKVLSAHRSPEKAGRYARSAASRGLRVIIAGAGGAAHLAGVMAAGSTLPVIGVPLSSSSLLGLDALLATVQMPAGIPVATVAVGRAGATNAGLLAVQILATSSTPLRRRLDAFKREMSRKVADQSSRAARDLRRLIGTAR